MDWIDSPSGESLLLQDDCLLAVQRMVRSGIRFDSIVTDPPYGVGAWDWGIPPVGVWATLLAALKPGAFMLVTGNPKTFHRQTTMIEDVGFRVCDCLMWLFTRGYSDQVGEASWAVHTEQMGNRARIQRGHLTADAQKWRGWGSKLRPAWEPIVLCQKPGESTMAKDLLKSEVGALYLESDPSPGQLSLLPAPKNTKYPPNNIVLDEGTLDEMSPHLRRYFYCRAVGNKERHAGVNEELGNDHPTVKPIALMRWLISLITPPRGMVLDPFVGSGTTGCAAMMEDCQFVGVDLDEHYLKIAAQRIKHWQREHETENREAVKATIQPRVRITRAGPQATTLRLGKRCRNGHPLTAETVYKRPDGREECMICKRLARQPKRRVSR